jgi:hypothetical protein
LTFEALENRLCLSTTIDAHALTLTLPQLMMDATAFSTATPQSFGLAPGSHTLRSPTGYGGSVDFTVDGSGIVNFDPSLAGMLSGQGTQALAVNGRPITVDVHALSQTVLSMDYIGITNESLRPLFRTAEHLDAVIAGPPFPASVVGFRFSPCKLCFMTAPAAAAAVG